MAADAIRALKSAISPGGREMFFYKQGQRTENGHGDDYFKLCTHICFHKRFKSAFPIFIHNPH